MDHGLGRRLTYRGAVTGHRTTRDGSSRIARRFTNAPHGLAVALVLLSVAAAAISLVSLELVHPALSWNRDEPVYLWHVDVLASGRLTAPGGDPIDAFRPWLGGIREGGYFSQYTLGWPVVLLASQLLVGTPAGAVVLGAVVAVVGAVLVTREVTGRDGVAVAVGVAFLATPAVVIQSGVHLGYLFTVGLGNLALTAGWYGVRTERRRWVLVAGALLGWILITRPFDAVLWGGVLLVGALVLHGRTAISRGWPVVVAGLPFVAVTVAYNLRVTGEALTFPIVAADPLDTFGLGRRRLMPTFEPVDYHVGRAAFSTLKNSAFFVLFLAGNLVAAGLAAGAVWWRRDRRETWILVVLGVAFPLGYFFFWGSYISSLTARLVGSIYYIPTIVPLLVLAVLGVGELHRRRRRLARVAVVAAALLTVPVMVSRLDVNRRISEGQEPWVESVRALEASGDQALVIVADSSDYLFFFNPQGRNGPELDDDILYAVDLGPGNFETIAAHPDRTPYLQISNLDSEELGPRESPLSPRIVLAPVEVRSGRSLTVEVRYRPLDGAPVAVPFVEVAGRTEWGQVSDATVGDDGTATARFTFGAGGIDVPERPVTVRVGFGAGQDVAEATTSPRIRWELSVDGSDGGLDALLPMEQEVRFPVGDEFTWYPRWDYPGASATALSP